MTGKKREPSLLLVMIGLAYLIDLPVFAIVWWSGEIKSFGELIFCGIFIPPLSGLMLTGIFAGAADRTN
jgi:hypothetical protein